MRNVAVVAGLESAVSKYADALSKARVFSKVPTNMDVHSYRRKYAMALYKSHQAHLEKIEGRKFEELPFYEKYYCRRDKAGICYDKKVMAYVSQQLGHNRINVIAGHYLD